VGATKQSGYGQASLVTLMTAAVFDLRSVAQPTQPELLLWAG
jgi:hypothetical protein